MLKQIRRLLSGPLPSIDKLNDAAATIDLAALDAALAAAQKRRTEMVLDGTLDEILAAERAVDEARIELERGQVALAELERRRAEAEAKATRAALERRHADVQGLVDKAVARIEAEYPRQAIAIAELAELAREADAAAGEWFSDLQIGRTDDLPPVEPVATRLGWHREYFSPPHFAAAAVLPPAEGFTGLNVRWPTKTEMWAVHGAGAPPSVPAQMN